MNTERLLSAGMAVVVIAAVGFSASTLATSMSTDPADAVDVQWDTLPLGEDSQGEIEAAAQDVDETYRQGGDADSQGNGGDAEQQDSQPSDGAGAERQPGEPAEDREPREGGAGDGDTGADSADRQGPEQAGQSGSALRLVPGGPPLSLLLWLALLLAVVILAYRYRERLRRALGSDADGAAEAPLSPAPQNDVERAWVELVQRAGVDRPRTLTPRDCARRAVETGFDPGHVDRLRRTFEDVRYGTTPPSDEQARVARETLDRLVGERA